MSNKKPIGLGDKARDIISGFSGIVIARTSWLYGCDRITIQSDKLDKDGKPGESYSFDEQQVELIRANAVKHPEPGAVEARPGGPRREPARASTPGRAR